MRLLNVDPSGFSLPAIPTQPTLVADENVRKSQIQDINSVKY